MIPFWKVHGIGNDFVLLDASSAPAPTPEQVRSLCDRHRGVGADGVLWLRSDPARVKSATARMWNPDGSESLMCGNGLRCFAAYLQCSRPELKLFEVELGGTIHRIDRVGVHSYRVQMQLPSFDPAEIPLLSDEPWIGHVESFEGHPLRTVAVSIGNPHWVLWDAPDFDLIGRLGRALEHDPRFPNRVNVHVAGRRNNRIVMRTWERGAGLTLACGSGACAVFAAAKALGEGRDRETIVLPGGSLEIESGPDCLWMSGEATVVCHGTWRAW